MALILQIKCVEGLKAKADRIVKVSFRGLSYNSKVVPKAKSIAYFGENFDWPIARPIEKHESLEIAVYNFNKYVSNKLIGRFDVVLQHVTEGGLLSISEPLIDEKNRLIQTRITFDLRYVSPDGKVGTWRDDEFDYPLQDMWAPVADGMDGDDETPLIHDDDISVDFDARSRSSKRTLDESSSGYSLDDREQYELDFALAQRRKRPDVPNLEEYKPKDFQVCIKIIEAQQLTGLNIDPVVRIDVGDKREFTRIKQSTNCPYFDEYFVFDFHLSERVMFDQMISITVISAYNIPGRDMMKAGKLVTGKIIGQFACDVGMVYNAPGRQFWHKWAVLLDPKDLGDGNRGFVQCDIAVIGRGDVLKEPKSDNDDTSIEGNLLLPEGLAKRQKAQYSVMIFRGEDMPRTDIGLFANVKKAITMDTKAFVDPFVRVTFLGKVGRTKVDKSYFPRWMEKIVFTDMFPPLCNRMKLELMDSDAMKDDVIGTQFINMDHIMESGNNDSFGFLPTFGASWLNFYGGPRQFKVLDQHDDLNTGMGEGVAYRGRLLMAIKTEMLENEQNAPSTVSNERMKPSSRSEVGPKQEFLLFCTLFEANMIDIEHKDKDLQFEISIGVAGNRLDGRTTSGIVPLLNDDDQENLESDERQGTMADCEVEELTHSTTDSTKPRCDNNQYCHMPYDAIKPCLFVTAKFEDTRKRFYNQNALEKIVSRFEQSMDDINFMRSREDVGIIKRIKDMLTEVHKDCERYMSVCNNFKSGAGAGRTNLDKKRLELCHKSVDRFLKTSRKLRNGLCKSNMKERLQGAKDLLKNLRQIAVQPQHSLPDVFIWLIANKKRVAYSRIESHDIIHSVVEEERGKSCGKLLTVFLRRPGKKGIGQTGWKCQAKLQMSFWLGLASKRRNVEYMAGLPPGYQLPPDYKNKKNKDNSNIPPGAIHYQEKQTYQLRAHIFQGRGIIGSDSTGLSDPFATVIIGNKCQSTQVCHETLCPYWNEQLVMDDIVLHGSSSNIKANPPTIVVEIFDEDLVGKAEFLGRALVTPRVKLAGEHYAPPDWPPHLEWWHIYRGPNKYGDILASFELLQNGDPSLRELPTPKPGIGILPVHPLIRPNLCTYRVEVLFWGVRELKRIHLISVDHPIINLELGGKTISSCVIKDIKKNSNFDDPLDTFLVELPDNEIYWPPVNIFCIDNRNFGRTVLVGNHVINHINKYMYRPKSKKTRELPMAPGSRRSSAMLSFDGSNQQPRSHADVFIDMDGQRSHVSFAQPHGRVIGAPNGSLKDGYMGSVKSGQIGSIHDIHRGSIDNQQHPTSIKGGTLKNVPLASQGKHAPPPLSMSPPEIQGPGGMTPPPSPQSPVLKPALTGAKLAKKKKVPTATLR